MGMGLKLLKGLANLERLCNRFKFGVGVGVGRSFDNCACYFELKFIKAALFKQLRWCGWNGF